MTKINLPEKLREIINLRNLLIISLFLLIVPISVSATNYNYTTLGYFYKDLNTANWDTLFDYPTAGTEYTSGASTSELDTSQNVYGVDAYDRLYRGYVIFNTNTLGGNADDYDVIIHAYLDYYSETFSLGDDVILALSDVNCANKGNPTLEEWDLYDSYYYGWSENWELDHWYDVTISGDYFLNPGGYSILGIRLYYDATDTEPIPYRGRDLSDRATFTNIWIEVIDAAPDYSVNLSGTGTFCYGNQLTFNLSSSPTALDGLYTLKFYKSGSDKYPTTDYLKQFAGTGPLLYSKSLEPGDCRQMSGYMVT